MPLRLLAASVTGVVVPSELGAGGEGDGRAPDDDGGCIHNTVYTLLVDAQDSVDTYLPLPFAMRSGDLALGMQCVARMSLVVAIASFLSSTTVWLYSKSNLRPLNLSPSDRRVRQSRCAPPPHRPHTLTEDGSSLGYSLLA